MEGPTGRVPPLSSRGVCLQVSVSRVPLVTSEPLRPRGRDQFWVQVGGKGIWFRVDFHVDLVKWALMEGKVLRVESVQEHCDHHFVVHVFRGLGS